MTSIDEAIAHRRAERATQAQPPVHTSPVSEMPVEDVSRLYAILEQCKRTGNVQPLFAVPLLLKMLSEPQWQQFLQDAKRAGAESKIRIDINALKNARKTAQRKSREFVNQDKFLSTVGLPRIVISNRQLIDLRSEAVSALRQANTRPVVFRRLREIVRFRIDSAGTPYIEPLTWISLRSRLAEVAYFFTEGELGPIAAPPPRHLCEDLIAFDHAHDLFPVIEAIVESPVVRIDGSIFATPGYDPDSKMIVAPRAGFTLPHVPESPSASDINNAKELLLDAVVDFPFEGPADRDNFFGFCLTPLIRPLLDVAPMAVFDSPVSGAGKGLLTDIASIIATGEVASVIPPPATREEWPKLLSSLLDNGRTFICFDNLHDALRSDALEAVLTKPFLQFRQLGHTRERIVPNKATWCLTGNNVAVSRDMVRRVFRIRIDPKCAQPHLRKDFKHSNLVHYCKTERANLLAALLVLVRAWFAAGKPAFSGTALGTYTLWKEMVGGILKHAGFDNFLANQRTLYSDMDLESEAWETFLLGIEARLGSGDFEIKRLVSLLCESAVSPPQEIAAIFGQTVSHENTKPNPYFAVKLSHVLRTRTNTRFGASEVFIERAGRDSHAKAALYRICHGAQK